MCWAIGVRCRKKKMLPTILEGLRQVAPGTAFDFVWIKVGILVIWILPRWLRLRNVPRKADLNIVVAGEYMMRFRWTDRTDGEDTDRSDLDLVGLQNELIRKVAGESRYNSYSSQRSPVGCGMGS